jgi:hypothetical protein
MKFISGLLSLDVPISSSPSFSSGFLSSLASFHFLLAGFHLFLVDFLFSLGCLLFLLSSVLAGCHFV